MFNLKVVGEDEAAILVCCLWPTCIVSLTSDVKLNWNYAKHLHVQVNDVAFVGQHTISPAPHHLERVLEFTADLTDDDRLLVHCFAGQSRSTAIAIAICIQHGMNYKEAFDHVESVRKILMPNQLFIQHIDNHFGLKNRLVKYVTERRTASLKRTLILPSGPPPQKEIDKMIELLEMFKDA